MRKYSVLLYYSTIIIKRNSAAKFLKKRKTIFKMHHKDIRIILNSSYHDIKNECTFPSVLEVLKVFYFISVTGFQVSLESSLFDTTLAFTPLLFFDIRAALIFA